MIHVKSVPEESQNLYGDTNWSSETIDSLKLLDSLQTGDILLTRSAEIGEMLSKNEWSHSAMVIRVEDPNSPLWDLVDKKYKNATSSTPRRGQLLLFQAVSYLGVLLFPLEARLARTERSLKRVGVRRLQCAPMSRPQFDALASFIMYTVSRSLQVQSMSKVQMVIRANSLPRLFGAPKKAWDWGHFFCAELVAEALQQLAIIREPEFAAFQPSTFSGCPGKHSGAQLENELCDGYSYAPLQLLLSAKGHLRPFLRTRRKELSGRLSDASSLDSHTRYTEELEISEPEDITDY
mmetsp:Transcript_4937/g.15002  ORF Transcript_4937/g.15002 Transcript_4937/m.15002 type:complete len:293 (+) Transcript_4937:151-1029(+)|eukprot:scaffold159551_cov31-Tisochrysis_lutea.AAC.2